MLPDDPLDPQRFPLYMIFAALIAVAIGLLVYNFSHNPWLGLATGVFLFIADYIGLKLLMGKDD